MVRLGRGDSEEMQRRDVRNRALGEQLKGGRNAQYRSSGNSMWLRVKSVNCVMLEPVCKTDYRIIGDISFFVKCNQDIALTAT